MAKFEIDFSVSDQTSILDVGGGQFNWQFLKSKPKVTILNLSKPLEWEEDVQYNFIIGDATNLQFPDHSFDIVYSNSVIEHLSTYENQNQMANEMMRVGKKVYCQTPAKEFFMEPHLITPFIHWFPLKIQSTLMRNFTIWGVQVNTISIIF